LRLFFFILTTFLVLPVFAFAQTDKQGSTGYFVGSNGYDYFKLTLNKDSTFEQHNKSCKWNYIAKGKWVVNNDSIMLLADKFYRINHKGKKAPITSESINSITLYYFNSLIILNADTLGLFYQTQDGKIKLTIELHRLPKK